MRDVPNDDDREFEEEAPHETGPLPVPAVYAVELPQDLVDDDAERSLRRLVRAGYVAYMVGGGVRDLLLNRKPKDFDIATDARPQDVKRVFRNCRIIGRRFRLCHLLYADQKVVECATFRRDPAREYEVLPPDLAPDHDCISVDPVRLAPKPQELPDDADLLIHHDNHFGGPHEDAVRRDFTINGLFYDVIRGLVIDYVGGMADLERRVVRTIGDPNVRFREDPIRILRAIKFSARLDMGIAPDVYDAMVEHRGDLSRAARPRVFEELLRLLRGGAAHRSIYLAWDMGVLGEILPELSTYLDDAPPGAEATWRRLCAIDRRVAEGELPSDVVLLTALLLGPIEEAISGVKNPERAFEELAEGITERLALPRRMRERTWAHVVALRRIAAGKTASITRRDLLLEALLLHELECEAAGRSLTAIEPDEDDEDGAPKKKRRRRRRKGAEGPE